MSTQPIAATRLLDCRTASRAVSAWIVLVACAFGQQQQVGDFEQLRREPDAARSGKSAEYLKASWQTWAAEVTCKGSYKVYLYTTSADVNSLIRDDGTIPAEAVIQGQGSFVKLARWLRIDVNHDSAFQDATLPDGSTGVSHTPSVSVTDGRRDIEFVFDPREPSPIGFHDFVQVSFRAGSSVLANSVVGAGVLPTPFNAGSPKLDVFDLPPPLSGDVGEIEFANVKMNAEQRMLEYKRRDQDNAEHLKELTFDIHGEMPQLIRWRQEMRTQGELSFGVRTTLSEFVDIGGYRVPQRVRQLLYRGDAGPVVVRVWSSEISPSLPAKADLLLTVPTKTKIRGLKRLPPTVDGNRTLDITSIADDDMYASGYPLSNIVDPDNAAALTKQADSGTPSRRMWLVVLNVGVLLLLLTAMAVKRTRGRGAR